MNSKFSNRHVTFESNIESVRPIRILIESLSFAGPYVQSDLILSELHQHLYQRWTAFQQCIADELIE